MSIELRRCCSSPLTDPHYDGCEVEALRVERWHRTRDAVLPAVYAESMNHSMTVADVLHDANLFADEAHGPLEFKP